MMMDPNQITVTLIMTQTLAPMMTLMIPPQMKDHTPQRLQRNTHNTNTKGTAMIMLVMPILMLSKQALKGLILELALANHSAAASEIVSVMQGQ
jgi:K+-transporting ATPase A subunit